MIDETLLYFAEGMHENEVVSMLAINVKIDQGEDKTARLGFYDLNRDRILRGSVTKDDTKGFTFKTDGGTLRFEKATIQQFNTKWRSRIEGQLPEFRYEQDLHEWYRRRFLGT